MLAYIITRHGSYGCWNHVIVLNIVKIYMNPCFTKSGRGVFSKAKRKLEADSAPAREAPGKHSIQSALRPTLKHWIREKNQRWFLKWCRKKYLTERSESMYWKHATLKFQDVYHDLIMMFNDYNDKKTGYNLLGDATFKKKNSPMEKAALETHPLGSFDQQHQPCLGSKVFSKCLVLVFMCGFPPIPASRLAPRLAKYMVSMLRLR